MSIFEAVGFLKGRPHLALRYAQVKSCREACQSTYGLLVVLGKLILWPLEAHRINQNESRHQIAMDPAGKPPRDLPSVRMANYNRPRNTAEFQESCNKVGLRVERDWVGSRG